MKTLLLCILTFIVGAAVGIFGGRHVDHSGPSVSDANEGTSQTKSSSAPEVDVRSAADKTKSRDEKIIDGAAADASALVVDPFAKWAAALKGDKPLIGERRADLLCAMAAKDGAAAWKALMKSGGQVTLKDVEAIGEAWGKPKGVDAATFGLTLTDPLQRPAFLRKALTAWLKADPILFLAWFQRQPANLDLARFVNASGFNMGSGGSFSRVSTGDDFTLGYLDAISAIHPPDPRFAWSLSGQFQNGFQDPKDRAEAVAWIKRQTDREWRDAAWKGLSIGLADKDVDAASAILPGINDETIRREVTSTIAARLAVKDAGQGFAYANALTDEAASKCAWQSVLATWAARDPAASLAFIQQNSPTLDPELVRRAADSWGKSDPVEAIQIVTLMPGDQSAWSGITGDIFWEWKRLHPQEARQWLASEQASILPADQLRRLRETQSGTSISAGRSSSSTTVNGRRITFSY